MGHPERSAEPETYVPDESEQAGLIELCSALDSRNRSRPEAQAGIITDDGILYEISPRLTDLLARVCRTLAEGQGVSVVPRHRWLTTQEAADLLGVPRPTLLGLLGDGTGTGTIPHEMRGRHRRVRLEDVLAYQDTLRRGRAAALGSKQVDAQVEGLYEVLDGPPRTTATTTTNATTTTPRKPATTTATTTTGPRR